VLKFIFLQLRMLTKAQMITSI